MWRAHSDQISMRQLVPPCPSARPIDCPSAWTCAVGCPFKASNTSAKRSAWQLVEQAIQRRLGNSGRRSSSSKPWRWAISQPLARATIETSRTNIPGILSFEASPHHARASEGTDSEHVERHPRGVGREVPVSSRQASPTDRLWFADGTMLQEMMGPVRGVRRPAASKLKDVVHFEYVFQGHFRQNSAPGRTQNREATSPSTPAGTRSPRVDPPQRQGHRNRDTNATKVFPIPTSSARITPGKVSNCFKMAETVFICRVEVAHVHNGVGQV